MKTTEDIIQYIQDLMDTGISQREIARQTDVSNPYLSQVRNGYVGEVSWDKGWRIYDLWKRNRHKIKHRENCD